MTSTDETAEFAASEARAHLSPGQVWLSADEPAPTFIRSPITEVLAAVEAGKAAGAAWLEVEVEGARILVVWPTAEADASLVDDGHASRPPTAAQLAQGAREPLRWDHYAPELRDELKALATRFRPDAVADAAVRLAELIALHGPPRQKVGPANGATS